MNSRSKSILFGIALLSATWVAAQAEDVKPLYEKECAKCHGSDGRGDTKMGKKLGAKDYSAPSVVAKMKDDAAFKAIKDGLKDKDDKTLMKPLKELTDDQVKSLIAFMRAFPKK